MYTLISDPVYFLSIAPLVLGGIAAGVGALASGVAGGLMNKTAQRDANKVNIQLAREQQQFAQKMIQQQNEYNTPVAQMQRYAQAGLNPNLVYSQGNPGNQTSIPSYQRADVKPALFNFQQNMGDVINSVFSNLQAVANIRKSNADARSTELDNLIKQGSWENQIQYDISRLTALDQFYRNPEYFLKNKELLNKLLGAQYNLTANNSALKRMEADWMNAGDIAAGLYPEGDDRRGIPNYEFVFRGNYNYKQALINNTLGNMALLPYKAASLRAGTSLKRAQINVQNMLVRKMNEDIRKLSIMNKDPRYYYSHGSFLDQAGFTLLGGGMQSLGKQIDRFVDWLESFAK